MVRNEVDAEIVPGALTAEPEAPATRIGEEEPEEVLNAGALFNPRAVVKYVSMWIIGPSMSTLLAYGFFLVVPFV